MAAAPPTGKGGEAEAEESEYYMYLVWDLKRKIPHLRIKLFHLIFCSFQDPSQLATATGWGGKQQQQNQILQQQLPQQKKLLQGKQPQQQQQQKAAIPDLSQLGGKIAQMLSAAAPAAPAAPAVPKADLQQVLSAAGGAGGGKAGVVQAQAPVVVSQSGYTMVGKEGIQI